MDHRRGDAMSLDAAAVRMALAAVRGAALVAAGAGRADRRLAVRRASSARTIASRPLSRTFSSWRRSSLARLKVCTKSQFGPRIPV